MKYFTLYIFTCLFAQMANAQLYIGAQIGQSQSEDADPKDLSYFLYTNIDSMNQDTDDTSYSVFFGYEFALAKNSYRTEIGWIDFGENSLEAEGSDLPVAGGGRRNATVTAEAEAFTVAGIYEHEIYPNLGLYGKVGVSYWDISGDIKGEVTDNMGNQIGSISRKASDDGFDLFWGLGVEYHLIFFQFERFKFGNAETDSLSLGIRYKLP